MDVEKRRILVFVVVTYALTWSFEIGVLWPALQGGGAAGSLLALVPMLLPALGVVIARLVTHEGFGHALLRPVRFRQTWHLWALGAFGTAGLIALGAALWFALNPADFDPSSPLLASQLAASGAAAGVDLSAQMPVIIASQLVQGVLLSPLVNFVPCLGEEWGWRGYLLPKLVKRMRVVPALVVSGVVWGLWHAPLIVMGHNYGVGYPGFPVAGILMMCVMCVVFGTFQAHLTLRSGSCVPAALAHGSLNGFATVGLIFSATGGNPFVGPMPTGIVGMAALIVVAAWMAARLVRMQRAGKEPLLTASNDDKSQQASTPVPPGGARR